MTDMAWKALGVVSALMILTGIGLMVYGLITLFTEGGCA